MHEAYSYQGHSIDVDIKELAGGYCEWTYFIDRRYCFQSEDSRSVLDTVRLEVLARAHLAVDKLDSIGRASREDLTLRSIDCLSAR